MSHDYQKSMNDQTLAVDQLGEKAADETTVENYGVHQEMQTQVTSSGATYKTMVGTFGMVPGVQIDVGYTAQRAEYFQKLAEQTGTQRNPLGLGSARETAAYRTPKAMAANYASDMNLLPQAQRDFDLFLPTANMAARSYMKTNEVADWLGATESAGPKLNAKDNAALNKASKDKGGGVLNEKDSLHLAARNMQSARMAMVSASQGLAAVVKSEAVAGLEEQLHKANERKETIQAQIEKAKKIGEYIETAGSVVAGGAGLVHEHLSAGKPHPKEEPDEVDLRPGSVEKTKGIGEGVETGGGYLGKAAAFGVELYHHAELERIHTKIDVVSNMLAAHQAHAAKAAVDKAKTDFDKAAHDYQTAVETYGAAIDDRRKNMAAMGASADKALGNARKDAHISDAMLYTTTLLETQSFLEVAMEAATAAKSTIDKVAWSNGPDSVYGHRDFHFGLLQDAYTGNNTPRAEGRNGADVAALTQMSHLVDWWLQGATELQEVIDSTASRQAEPVLESANYTGKY